MSENLRTIEWIGDLRGRVCMIDQTQLPCTLQMIECRDPECVWDAIKRLRVRGAPAIGIAAAMGLVLGVRDAEDDVPAFLAKLEQTAGYLASSRPTAVNLFWALHRMKTRAHALRDRSVPEIKQALLEEAKKIRDEDAAMCRAIGRHGQHLVGEGIGVLTHCNAGALATAEYGTALAPLYDAHAAGRRFRVWVDETRPLLQGSRLTAWELDRAGIETVVICDNMAATFMRQRKINLVITGADRIAANGDTANKIGTYGVAVLARVHDIPFYVAAPSTTFDPAIASGDQIPIEQRDPEEIRRGFGSQTAPEGVACDNPAFDVTPASLITGIITEKGLIQPVSAETIKAVIESGRVVGSR